MNRLFYVITMIILSLGVQAISAPMNVELTAYTDESQHKISPMLYGLFFEDINFAADGGLYAEMVRNRSFEFKNNLFGWSKDEGQTGLIEMKVLDKYPLNKNNPHYLSVIIQNASDKAGIKNSGYRGMAVKNGNRYLFSVYARSAEDFKGNLLVRLENSEGQNLGQARIQNLTSDWQKHTAIIESNADEENAVLALLITGQGRIDMDMVSLFPEDTWKRQTNGLRADLVQMLADMKPAFLRFPGGCIVEGKDLANAYRWKDTIGDPAQRKLNWNRWAGWNNPPEYYQSYGLGFFEYFRLCEDIGAEPVPILNCGMSCQYQDAQLVPLDELNPYVQDALDLIEYANGPAESTWGAKRAAAGHPEPFNLKYLGVGNEQWDEQYFERYNIFYKAIKAKYPEIKIITTSGPGAAGGKFNLAWGKFKSGASPAEIVDEHYYMPPQWFLRNTGRYDDYDRSGPKVFAGEYAAHASRRQNSLFAALTEAAFITGLERNSDIVIMSSYAPLLARVDAAQWAPDLIWFDKTKVYGTPSYYVQKLFSTHSGTDYLKSEMKKTQAEIGKPAGRIGLCTWQTSSEFKDVKVTRNGEVLFSSMNSSDWQSENGQWEFTDGKAVQLQQNASGALCVAGDSTWSDYTLSLKARKIRGDEGFLVVCRLDESGNGVRWNIGGWGNTQHAVQVLEGGSDFIAASVPGSVETDRWYDVRVILKGDNVRCLLDGKEIHSVDVPKRSTDQMYASCTRDEQTKKTTIKAVNPTAGPIALNVNLKGKTQFVPQASVIVLTGKEANSVNTLDEPENVYPQLADFNITGNSFSYELKPYSMVFFKLSEPSN